MSDRQPDDDMQDVVNRLQSGLGPRRDPDELQEPVYGADRPIPPEAQPQVVQMSLPFYPARAWLVLLVINIIVYLISCVLSGGLQPTTAVLDAMGAKDNQQIYLAHEYWRFLTAMFLHGGILHIAFNGYALYIIGPETERTYGTGRFLALYFIAGIAGGVASYAFSPYISVGASGAIFGLIGGLAAFYLASRRVLGDIARRQLGSLVTVIMLNLFIGFSGGNIDNFAHIGGLVGGFVVGWLLAPRFEVDARLYPPVIVRRFLPVGWLGALGVLALLAALVLFVIVPPGISQP